MKTGQTVTGVYYADSSKVETNTDTLDIIGENDEYLSLFRRGRSVYEALVGSTYQPARIFFVKVIKREQQPNPRVSMLSFKVLLESSVRKN